MHQKLYAQMLRCYPASFRNEFAAEMAGVFADALRDARVRGSLAVARLWWREARSLPRNVVQAIVTESEGPRHPRLAFAFAVALLAIASYTTSHLIANEGLFAGTSLVILLAGLAFGGFFFGMGAASRRTRMAAAAIALVFGALLGAVVVDRAALRLAPNGTQSLTLPGVKLDASRVTNDATFRTIVEQARATGSPRVHIRSYSDGNVAFVRVVRAGGVDGAYMLFAALLLAITARAGWSLVR